MSPIADRPAPEWQAVRAVYGLANQAPQLSHEVQQPAEDVAGFAAGRSKQ